MPLAKFRLLDLILLLSLAAPRTVGQIRPNFGSIEGTVVDQSGKPVAGATVEARVDPEPRRRNLFTTSDSAGRFVLRDIPSGDTYLYAHKESEGYPDTFFAFFKTDDLSMVSVKVNGGQATQGVTIRLGGKAAYLSIEMSDENGTRLPGQLIFTRDDDEYGRYQKGTIGAETIMVPPVPFRLTAEAQAPGYLPWHYGGENWQSDSGLIKLKSGQSLDLNIRLKRAQ